MRLVKKKLTNLQIPFYFTARNSLFGDVNILWDLTLKDRTSYITNFPDNTA